MFINILTIAFSDLRDTIRIQVRQESWLNLKMETIQTKDNCIGNHNDWHKKGDGAGDKPGNNQRTLEDWQQEVNGGGGGGWKTGKKSE